MNHTAPKKPTPQTIDPILQGLQKHPHISCSDQSFAELTTLHLGGKPLATIHCHSTQALAQAVRELDAAEIPLLVVGGGSNLVVADGDIPLIAVVAECDAIDLHPENGIVHVEAGAIWDDVVETSIAAGLAGIECLSGIPGTAGATPVQNVGAYGVEISDVLESVQLYNRHTGTIETVPASALELAYRYSNLKFTNRAVVLSITLRLNPSEYAAPLRFGALGKYLSEHYPDAAAPKASPNPENSATPETVAERNSEPQRWAVQAVRESVLALRQSKGMVYAEEDHDTWSAGSFFTNPIVTNAQVNQVLEEVRSKYGDEKADTMPRFPAGEGQQKLSAAWLIEHSGFAKGYPDNAAAVRLSTKHTLALTNRGYACTADLVALAREIRAGVQECFGVELHPEPVWVGVQIDASA